MILVDKKRVFYCLLLVESFSIVMLSKNSFQKTKHISNFHIKKSPIFIWPLDVNTFWISCYFGRRQRKRLHSGIDLAAMCGTPVKASASGTVTVTCEHTDYGKMILINHSNDPETFETRYAHLDRILVKPEENIKQGKIVGFVGNTGRVSGKNGEHLHFEILCNTKPINPLRFLPPRS